MKIKNLADTGQKRLLWRRILIYSGIFFLLGIIQCSFYSHLKPFGATPDIVLGAIIALGMFDSKKTLAVCAVGAGYFIDALGSLTPSFTPIFYLACALAVSALSYKMMNGFLAYVISLSAAFALGCVYTFAGLLISMGAFPTWGLLWHTLPPYFISSIVLSLPLYPIIKGATNITCSKNF